MDEVIKEQMEKNLVWLPKQGVGYFPVTPRVYNDEYFNKYVVYENTEIGRRLNSFRINLVNRYTRGQVLDIGIGCGTFIKLRGRCMGYDVNPKAVRFLKSLELFYNPHEENLEKMEGITFFDSLEHIEHPGRILNKVKGQFVFVSIPIFRDLEHLLSSKHLREDEHFYYFTKRSFIRYMASFGFKLLEFRDDEIKCGREDIYTFVLRKGV